MNIRERYTVEEFFELADTSIWWKEISDEIVRAYNVGQVDVPGELAVIVVQSMFEVTKISKANILKAKTDSVYQKAYRIISKMKSGETFGRNVLDLGVSQLPRAKKRLSVIARRLIAKSSTPKLDAELTKLWQDNREVLSGDSTEELSKKLGVSTPSDRYILRCLTSISICYKQLSTSAWSPFGSEKTFSDSSVKGSNFKRAHYLAYRVYDPLWNNCLYCFEPRYVDFPFKWVGAFMPVAFSEHLYSLFKRGRDVTSALIEYYEDEERITRLSDAIHYCPVTKIISDLFDEAIKSYIDKRYKVCSVAFLSIIEGLIWAFSWEWNRVHGGIFDRPLTKSQFYDIGSFQLLASDGKKIGGRPNVGNLLRKTCLQEGLYVEVIEFLCEELFDERNDVLHGRNPRYGDLSKAVSLLFVIETIERAITGLLKKEIAESVKDFLRKHGLVKSL